MELRSFLSGILFLYGVQVLLPFIGVNISVSTPSPIFNLVSGIVALVLAYYLFRN